MSSVGYEFLPDTPALEVELLSDQEALEVGLNPAAYRGEPGKSPRIGADDCWEVYDETTGEWLSTGVNARGGITDYAQLPNKPRINGHELVGDQSAAQLGLENRITNTDIEGLFKEGGPNGAD